MGFVERWIQAATLAVDQASRALLVSLGVVETSKDAALSGPQSGAIIWAPASGRAICLSTLTFTVDADCTVTIFRGTNVGGKRLIHQAFKAGSGVSLPYIPMFRCGVDEALKVTTTAGNINITATGSEV